MTGKVKDSGAPDEIYLLKEITERRTKQGKPYLAVVLGTPDGDVEGRIWDMELKSLPAMVPGDPVLASGKAGVYQDRKQLVIDRIEKVSREVDPRQLYPSSEISEGQLRKDYAGLVSTLREPALIQLFNVLDQDAPFMDAFFTSPAAVSMHHARIGGLAEHSLAVCRLAVALGTLYPWLRTDLLVAGGLLHDVGKTKEYEVSGDFRYSREGKLIGHITLGVGMVSGWIDHVAGFPEDLALQILHIVLSHHGQLEHGSPRTPATPEALVIHYADDLDAKLDMLRSASADPDAAEAFVRGLRRTFLFAPEGPGEEDSEAVRTEDRGPDTSGSSDQGELF
ncbi:MAG: HD domain-containing protein [bacterium]|nr:MAG: HD domain-containing protein [bacterium]